MWPIVTNDQSAATVENRRCAAQLWQSLLETRYAKVSRNWLKNAPCAAFSFHHCQRSTSPTFSQKPLPISPKPSITLPAWCHPHHLINHMLNLSSTDIIAKLSISFIGIAAISVQYSKSFTLGLEGHRAHTAAMNKLTHSLLVMFKGMGTPKGMWVRVQRVRAVLSSPPPIPAGLAGVLQESWGLCQTGRAWQDWDRVQQDFC